MFWRFGFNNGSSIDSLLDKEDVSLEAILDEDDILQECKAQNTRLIDYFQRVDVLQRLLGYVTGEIEVEEKSKYSYVATEVLCSEIWSIVETCINHSEQLLTPFWETVLDRSPEDMRMQMVMASHFAKINAIFLNKKPVEMLEFILAQPAVVERILQHIETPAFSDLLVRIIQLDEQPVGAGVLEWLSNENLIARLIDRLSPSYSPDMHTVVSELVKGIISMATPGTGAGIADGLQNSLPSNLLVRVLARHENVQKLFDFILHDFGTGAAPESSAGAAEKQDSNPDEGPFVDDSSVSATSSYPNVESSTSSVVQSICIIVELMRQNNSDYFEPYLFYILRNRLMHTQQTMQVYDRDALERNMKEIADHVGVVHLRPLLEIICDRLEQLNHFLRNPRSFSGTISTTIGKIAPLTFERYRICELYGEIFHCSGLGLLNRPAEFDNMYNSEGLLQGGLSGLDELSQFVDMGPGSNRDQEAMDEGGEELEPALELPVHGASHYVSSLSDSDDDMSDGDGPGSSDDDAMEEIAMYDEPKPMESSPGPPSPTHTRSPAEQSPSPIAVSTSPGGASSSPTAEQTANSPLRRRGSTRSNDSETSTTGRRSAGSRRSSRRITIQDLPQPDVPLPIGERLKQKYLEVGVLSTLMDLFFEYPWNNFLHNVVYDLFHQILTGHTDSTNRALILSLFRDARLMRRIVDGQRRNDTESAKPKGVRLGYMGYLTLMADDVLMALETFPPDLRLAVAETAPQPDWDEYVTGRYNETKKKDTSVLGGGKPSIVASAARPGATQWRVDEQDTSPAGPSASSASGSGAGNSDSNHSGSQGEFRRATSARPTKGNSADFRAAFADDDDDDDDDFTPSGHPHFARYLAQEMHSPDEFGSSSSPDHSDDEDSGWLAQSHFDLDRQPPVSTRPRQPQRRPLSANGFEDSFVPRDVSMSPFGDPFSTEDDEDEGFGPFSDSAAASGSDPFTFSSRLTEDAHDASFDSFGDFGEFHTADADADTDADADADADVDADVDGETTPTAGSWTFASGSSVGSDVGSEAEDVGKAEQQPREDAGDAERGGPAAGA